LVLRLARATKQFARETLKEMANLSVFSGELSTESSGCAGRLLSPFAAPERLRVNANGSLFQNRQPPAFEVY